MELEERTYGDECEHSELADLSYQRANGRLRWYESERGSQRDVMRSAAIILLIVVCVFLILEPNGSIKNARNFCAEPGSVMSLKASSTGE